MKDDVVNGLISLGYSWDCIKILCAKAALIAIKPNFASYIFSGEKVYELRRRPPKCCTGLYIVYESAPTSSITGLFVSDSIVKMPVDALWMKCGSFSCVEEEYFKKYFLGCEFASAIHIVDVYKFDRQYLISSKENTERVPQSFTYIKDIL